MQETFEFRVNADFAPLLFAESEGRNGELVRVVRIKPNDPRFPDIGRLQRECRAKHGRPFFFGWSIERSYSRSEHAKAALYRLGLTRWFEPAGEECGTVYNESAACSRCGAGARQETPLRLDIRRIPRGVDFACSIAGEIVVSAKAATLLSQHSLNGIRLLQVENSAGVQESLGEPYFQLLVEHGSVDIVPPTQTGIEPFDLDRDGAHRCMEGDVIGLNLLSPVSISRNSDSHADLFASNQFVGMRQGLLRPSRVLFSSPRLIAAISASRLRGIRPEIAYVQTDTPPS